MKATINRRFNVIATLGIQFFTFHLDLVNVSGCVFLSVMMCKGRSVDDNKIIVIQTLCL